MTEPPRPSGDGGPPDPTAPLNPYPPPQPPTNGPPPAGPPPSFGPPSSGPPPFGPPSSGAGGYGPPPSSGAGGYGPPPSSGAGGYGPQPGPPPYGYAPPAGPVPGGYATEDERTWTLVAHFGGAVLAFLSGGWLGWIAPLVALFAKGNLSPAVRRQVAEALNFQLLWAVVALAITVISTCLSFILIGLVGFLLLVVPWLMGTIFGIVAGVKAANGEPYHYPGAPNWVK